MSQTPVDVRVAPALAVEAAAMLARRTTVASHDIAIILGSGWRPTADVIGATRRYCGATTDPSWPAARWPTGPPTASGWRSSLPANPWRNGYIESFDGRLRDEYLNINMFWSLTQAQVVISDWTDEYNHHRSLHAGVPDLGRLRCRLHPPETALTNGGITRGVPSPRTEHLL